jgi:hypothetical protein
MINSTPVPSPDEVRGYYQEAFRAFAGEHGVPEITLRFYPYVGINHTIRIRQGRAFVRISSICRDMPAEAHRGLAYILVGKLMRRRPPEALRRAYHAYIETPEVRDRATENKRTLGRKMVSGAAGRHYDLDLLFDSLNSRYFRSELKKPVLTWSARKTYRILGHHDSTHDTVVVSRSLDEPAVPRFVVEHVLFHEMLHIAHPTVHHNGRRYNHTPAFRRDERKFEHFHAAEAWIENNVRRMKRAAKAR